MKTKINKMTVKEVKEIEPKAEVYELNKYSKYLITVKKSPLAGGDAVAQQKAKIILEAAKRAEINCVVLVGVDEDVKFMEIN